MLGTILKFYVEVFSDQNLAYYLFSTIVQGFLALVGFLGAVAIFKIQLLESDMTSITNFIRPWIVSNLKGDIANGYSSLEMMAEIEKFIQEGGSNIRGDHIQIAHEKFGKIYTEKSVVRRVMVDFALWSFFNVSWALIGIPLSKLLIFEKLYFILALYSMFNIVLSLASIYVAFVMIRGILGYSFVVRV